MKWSCASSARRTRGTVRAGPWRFYSKAPLGDNGSSCQRKLFILSGQLRAGEMEGLTPAAENSGTRSILSLIWSGRIKLLSFGAKLSPVFFWFILKDFPLTFSFLSAGLIHASRLITGAAPWMCRGLKHMPQSHKPTLREWRRAKTAAWVLYGCHKCFRRKSYKPICSYLRVLSNFLPFWHSDWCMLNDIRLKKNILPVSSAFYRFKNIQINIWNIKSCLKLVL